MKHKIILVLLLIGWAGGQLMAQTTLQVVSKNIRKTIAWKPGMEVIINGEKAEVIVMPSDSALVTVEAELTARHPSSDTAQLDVEMWQFVAQTSGKKIYIRSYVGVQAGKRPPVSSMKSLIKVLVPKNCPLELSNKYGKADIQQLTGPVALTGEFCKFELTQLSGPLKVESAYGQIDGNHLDGKVDIRSRRADVNLQSTSADCAIASEYGTIKVTTTAASGNVRIAGNKSNITLKNTADTWTHNYLLRSEYGQLDTPANFDTTQADAANTTTKTAQLKTDATRPVIEAQTSFGKVIVESIK
jgi:hypothetical protein